MHESSPSTPERIFETLQGYQRTAALKSAVEFDLFTAIAEGATTAAEIGAAVTASERGTRMLCDYLVVLGFLNKSSHRYALASDAAMFLCSTSPTYLGSLTGFLLSPGIVNQYDDLTDAVRRGGARSLETSTVAPEWPTWVAFARSMAPMMAGPANAIAEMLTEDNQPATRVLDIAAGHGLFGIAIAQRNPDARIVALDWPAVLDVAQENAHAAGVSDRHELRAGDAFEADLGEGHDVVLLTNFLHHFDGPACDGLLRRVQAAMADDGVLVTLEFVPDEDRVHPPLPAMFALQMLAGTPAGDAYTFGELDAMFRAAGFSRNERRTVADSMQTVILSRR